MKLEPLLGVQGSWVESVSLKSQLRIFVTLYARTSQIPSVFSLFLNFFSFAAVEYDKCISAIYNDDNMEILLYF